MDMWQKYEKDSKTLDNFYDRIKNDTSYENLRMLYQFMKRIASEYYHDQEIIRTYEILVNEFLMCEKLYDNGLLINPIIHFSDLNQDFPIEYLVYEARKYLLKEYAFIYGNEERNQQCLQEMNMSNKCLECSEQVKIANARKTQLEFHYLLIYPAYKEKCMIYNGGGHHCACIVKYNVKYYLIDVTYSQFFYKYLNNLDRLGIMETSGCKPGYFMLMTEKGRRIANQLLSYGYVELDEETFKSYLDSFTISFRNGLYYEKTQDFSYIADYSIDDYIKFLKGEDAQLKHEDIECLGFQKRPLKNPQMSFQKRS